MNKIQNSSYMQVVPAKEGGRTNSVIEINYNIFRWSQSFSRLRVTCLFGLKDKVQQSSSRKYI